MKYHLLNSIKLSAENVAAIQLLMKRAIQADNQICYIYEKLPQVIAARWRANNQATEETFDAIETKKRETEILGLY